jgi:hypothetical protein
LATVITTSGRWGPCRQASPHQPGTTPAVGGDYQTASGTLTFAPGETVKTVPVAVSGDRLGEPDEYFAVNLTGSAIAPIDWGHAVGVIVATSRAPPSAARR